jgi:hypothetical protein
MATSNASNSKKLKLQQMKVLVDKQAALVKSKNDDCRKYSALAKKISKGKSISVLMQQQMILNSKKQDAFRAKQKLLQMKLAYKTERERK